ncbi:MAG: hypothetical protein IT319_02500 [Anaerolineae bacterium]|nr:hypothetical protein [Anaerolineae bacterium]
MSPNGKHNPDAEQPEMLPEGVEEVGAFLHRWRAPDSDPAAKARVLEMLTDELASRAHSRAPLQYTPSPRNLRWAWLLLRSQARFVHPAAWVGSGLVIALGALVALIFSGTAHTDVGLPLVIVAPIVAACGVAFLYGVDADPALELQLATPVSPRLILLARLALLFGFNLTITLACSVLLVLLRSQISLLPLIASWLAPMTFLSALAFLLSALFFDSLASVLVSLLLWIGTALRHFVDFGAVSLYVPDLLRGDLRPVLWIAAPALVVIALWIVEREERWTGGGR